MKENFLFIIVLAICLGGCGTSGMQATMSDNTQIINGQEGSTTEENLDIESESEKESQVESGIEIDTTITSESDILEAELNLLQKVLLNQETFNEGQKIEDDEYIYSDKFIKSVSFFVVDLDRDGKNEVIIDAPSQQVLILHENEGKVYGFYDSYRGYAPLYVDGTSEGSSSADAVYFLGNISFENSQYKQEYIVTIVYEADGTRYYKNGTESSGVEISEEEYNEIMSQYAKKEATRYKFTVKNILEYVK